MTTVDATLDDAFTTILAKAQQQFEQVLFGATLNFIWPGGGQSLVLANLDPLSLEIPYDCRIVYATLRAGDANAMPVSVSATISLQLSTFSTFGAYTPVNVSGANPTLTSQSSNNCSLTGWHVSLAEAESMTARVTAFTGTATWLWLAIKLRPTFALTDSSNYVNFGQQQNYTTAGGQAYTFRVP